MGKNFANKKSIELRPKNDFYETPVSLTWELLKTDVLKGVKTILEPCCGKYQISKPLEEAGFKVTSEDICYGQDFLKTKHQKGEFDAIVSNPPFSNFDEIVLKAKEICNLVVVIGKVTMFGAHNRNVSGFWNGLKDVYIFDRQVEYRTPHRDDGKFLVGMLVSGWFVFDNNYYGDPKLHMIDVQQYATLGSYDTFVKKGGM